MEENCVDSTQRNKNAEKQFQFPSCKAKEWRYSTWEKWMAMSRRLQSHLISFG